MPTPTLDQMQQKMAGLSVPFEANQGQFAPEVAFAARTFAGTLFVTRDGKIVHALAGRSEQAKESKKGNEAPETNESTVVSHTPDDHIGKNQTPRGPSWALVESLQGASAVTPKGSQPSATRVSRFAGGAAPNQTSSIATFDRVRLEDAWPGVSVELAARGSNVEKLFTVAPGTNPKTIRMGVAGAKRLHLGNDGSLIATTGNGDVSFTPPVAFQGFGGQRSKVPVKYQLLADNSYRFEIGAYNHRQSLVIDPVMQSTYVGAAGEERTYGLALDAASNVLVAGYTTSTSFPGTVGGAQLANGGGSQDAFIARLSNNLDLLLQATYLGGSGFDEATALALDASGNVLVAGTTTSTNLPGTTGGAQPTIGSSSAGVPDAFVARLSSNLSSLLQATYLGGNTLDQAAALTLDASGNVLVAGVTTSINFPGTAGGAQSGYGGNNSFDVFVAKLSGNLATLAQSTYLGGIGSDTTSAIAIDAGGSVVVAGGTNTAGFPGTSSGAQPALGGGSDAFVARLSNSLTSVMQATYLGGGNSDSATALAFDANGNVLIAGNTSSSNLPGTMAGAQATSGGGASDGFVARLSPMLGTLMQATYLGGNGNDQAAGLALDAAGNVLVGGRADTTNFPGTTGCAQPANGGGFGDAYVARLSSNLHTLVQATYIGGSGFDAGTALALDAGGNVFVAGYTQSTNFPGSAFGAQTFNAGGNDAFVAKLPPALLCDGIFANGFE